MSDRPKQGETFPSLVMPSWPEWKMAVWLDRVYGGNHRKDRMWGKCKAGRRKLARAK